VLLPLWVGRGLSMTASSAMLLVGLAPSDMRDAALLFIVGSALVVPCVDLSCDGVSLCPWFCPCSSLR